MIRIIFEIVMFTLVTAVLLTWALSTVVVYTLPVTVFKRVRNEYRDWLAVDRKIKS